MNRNLGVVYARGKGVKVPLLGILAVLGLVVSWISRKNDKSNPPWL